MVVVVVVVVLVVVVAAAAAGGGGGTGVVGGTPPPNNYTGSEPSEVHIEFTRYLRCFRHVLPLLVASKSTCTLGKLQLRISQGFVRGEGVGVMVMTTFQCAHALHAVFYSTFVISYHFLLPQISTCRLCKLKLREAWFDKRSWLS